MECRPQWEVFFFFFVPKPHVVTFTAVYREECCVVLPWTKASERYVSFMRQLLLLFFFSYHLTCYFSFIVYHLAHAREEANNEVRSRTVLDKTTCERLHDKLIVLNLIDIYKRFRLHGVDPQDQRCSFVSLHFRRTIEFEFELESSWTSS